MTDAMMELGPVLTFWFEEVEEAKWFDGDADLDGQIASRFRQTYLKAAQGLLDDGATTAAGALALLILLDQFPRNMFRGTGRAYATDEKALGIARAALAAGFPDKVPPRQRKFFYVPFEHSEAIEDQILSVQLFEALGEEKGIDAAHRHRDVIARFGRFPHRNIALKRGSTAEELRFLSENPRGF